MAIEVKPREQSATEPAWPSCRRAPGPFCAEDVHNWFELSYSSYLVLPRTLMQEMSPAWQHALVQLLERMHEEFPGEASRYIVLKVDDRNRFEKDPLRNYRYPNPQLIDSLRYPDDDG